MSWIVEILELSLHTLHEFCITMNDFFVVFFRTAVLIISPRSTISTGAFTLSAAFIGLAVLLPGLGSITIVIVIDCNRLQLERNRNCNRNQIFQIAA